MNQVHYRIAMVGPSRVGKTSLIATLLADGERALAGMPVSLVPQSTTKRRIDRHKDDLLAGLNAGEFSPGTLIGNNDEFVFELTLQGRDTGDAINLEVMDYPGGWTDGGPTDAHAEKWAKVQAFLRQASVLIIPIDATVLMEAELKSQREASRHLLEASAVERVARNWAKERALSVGEPASLFLVPVKCESYLADNGGGVDRSGELSQRVKQMYEPIVDAVRAEMGDSPDVYVYYCPVDTLGCVELMSAEWTPASGVEPPRFLGHFRLRPPRKPSTLGMSEVLTRLCHQLVSARERVLLETAHQADAEARAKRKRAEQSDGFFGDIWNWITNEDQRREKAAKNAERNAVAATTRVESVSDAVEELARRSETRRRLVAW